MGNAEGVQSRHGRLPVQFHDLEFPHNGTSLRCLVKPKEASGDRENGIVPVWLLIGEKENRERSPAERPFPQNAIVRNWDASVNY
jgi:hypothetical protein